MVTASGPRDCTPARFKTCLKVCTFMIAVACIVLFVNTRVNWRSLRLVYNDMETYTRNLFIPTTKNCTAEDLFLHTCRREELYRVDRFMNVSAQQQQPSDQQIFSVVPTSNKTQCPRVLTLSNFSLPFTALLSFPGSGNTWTRHLLQQLTGIPTGSVYRDKRLLHHGFPFEGRVDDKVIAVKTHGNYFAPTKQNIAKKRFERVILVVRNVFKSILAESRRQKVGQTETIDINTTAPVWRAQLRTFIDRWDRLMKDGLAFPGPLLIVYYEDLKSQLLTQLKRVASFLANEHLNQFSLCCALKGQEGGYHRKPNHNQTVEDVFSKEDRLLVNGRIESLAKFLKDTYPDVSKRILTYRMPV